MIYKSKPKTQSWAGESIGIIVLDCNYPFIPGNVANATTYDFPVRYAVAEGVTPDILLYEPSDGLIGSFIAAAKRLEAEGVKAIAGACGFMALFQREISAAANIPVFSSSLLQLNFMYQITQKRIGVICADSTCLKAEHLERSGVLSSVPLAIRGMENKNAFVKGILHTVGVLDDDAVRKEVVDVSRELVASNPDVGSILLECSDLPPYAHDVQAATGLPVFDFITMINYVQDTLNRSHFTGHY